MTTVKFSTASASTAKPAKRDQEGLTLSVPWWDVWGQTPFVPSRDIASRTGW